MPQVYTPNVVMIEMIYQAAGTRMENVYHFEKGAPYTLAELQTLWTFMRDWEQNTARLRRHLSCSLVHIALTAMDGPGAPVYEAVVNPVIVGSKGGTLLPNVMSLAVRHTTGLAGRSFRGRTYWMGLTTSDMQNADQMTLAEANALAAACNTLRTTAAAAGHTFVVVSKYSGVDSNGRAIPRPAGVTTPIVQSGAEVGYDTQRHRKLPWQGI